MNYGLAAPQSPIHENFNTLAFSALQGVGSVLETIDVSEGTRAAYQARIGLFLAHIKHDGLNRDSFLNFKRALNARADYSVSTKNAYLTSARVLLRELHRRGLIPSDLTANVKSFQQYKKHKRDGVNDDEMASLVEWLRRLEPSPANARLKAVISLLALQGLRQIEVVRLNVADLELGRQIAYVHGKGRDDKEPVSLHPETVKSLLEHLRASNIADGPVFTSRSHNSLNHRLTTKSIRLLIKTSFAQLGIDRSTHSFRHWYVTRLIRAYKGDLLQVTQYTRHRSLEMLEVYYDGVRQDEDLPRYHQTFAGLMF
jgi:integrase